jgi:ketosteroid isomerase-like protein
MPESNVEALKRVYDAFNRGDFDEAATLAHPEVEFLTASGSATRGVVHLREWMEPDAFEEQTFEPLEFIVAANGVLVKQRIRARGAGSGIELEAESWALWTFDDAGRVIRLQGFLDFEREAAFAAAGLEG